MNSEKLSFEQFVKLGIPSRFAAHVNLTPFQEPGIQSSLDKFTAQDPPKRGLLILGTRGTGKTTAMAEIAKSCATYCEHTELQRENSPSGEFQGRTWVPLKRPQPKSMKFITFWDFIADLRKSYSTGEPYARNLADHDFVFLDDLGKIQTNRDWFIECFQEFVDVFYNQTPGSKLLYVTSNLTAIEISNTFGDACKDRLDDLCYTVQMTGKSRRGL